jgi:hypothetical protein
MPLKQGITIEEVIKEICWESCSPPYEPKTEQQRAIVTSVCNAGYMILRSMGFTP